MAIFPPAENLPGAQSQPETQPLGQPLGNPSIPPQPLPQQPVQPATPIYQPAPNVIQPTMPGSTPLEPAPPRPPVPPPTPEQLKDYMVVPNAMQEIGMATSQDETAKSGSVIGKVISVFFVFLSLAAIAGGALYAQMSINNYKKETKDVVKKQVGNLIVLGNTYREIVKVINEETQIPKTEDQPMLLGVSVDTTKENPVGEVLSSEEDPSIITQRKLIELYKKGKSQTEEIDKDTNKLFDRRSQLPWGIFMPDPDNLINKTNDYTTQTKAVMSYLEKDSQLGIEYLLKARSMGVALGVSIASKADEASMVTLEEKYKEFKAIASEWSNLNVEGLPEDLQKLHLAQVKEIANYNQKYDEVMVAMRNKNGKVVGERLQDILVSAAAEGDSANSKLVSFWQSSETVKVTEDLKKEWDSYSLLLN